MYRRAVTADFHLPSLCGSTEIDGLQGINVQLYLQMFRQKRIMTSKKPDGRGRLTGINREYPKSSLEFPFEHPPDWRCSSHKRPRAPTLEAIWVLRAHQESSANGEEILHHSAASWLAKYWLPPRHWNGGVSNAVGRYSVPSRTWIWSAKSATVWRSWAMESPALEAMARLRALADLMRMFLRRRQRHPCLWHDRCRKDFGTGLVSVNVCNCLTEKKKEFLNFTHRINDKHHNIIALKWI